MIRLTRMAAILCMSFLVMSCAALPALQQELKRLDEDTLVSKYEKGRRDFAGAQMFGADLTGADLRGVDLSGADLTAASLVQADLRGAQLISTSLLAANLSHARLDDSNLTDAVLENADLSGADLARVTGLRQDQLDATKSYVDAEGLPRWALADRRNVEP